MLPSYQTDDIPIWGLFISSSDKPTPYRIACEPPWDFGSVMRLLYWLSFRVCAGGGGGGGGGATVSVEEMEEARTVRVGDFVEWGLHLGKRLVVG